MSKSRVAPLKVITLPRLELQAAVLAVRIQNMLLNEMTLNIDQIFLWTDSTIVLAYIQNESRRFKTFVANRVAEIRDGSGVEQWRHIDGKINPADYGTRGVPLNSLTANHPWLTGPEFLLKDESLWPNNIEIPGLDDNDPELKRAVTMNVTIDGAPPLIDMTKFSSWKRIKRIMSWIYRFLRRCRTKHGEWIGYEVVPKLLLLEVNAGERFAVFLIQREVYGKELRALSEGNAVPSTSSLQRLMPFIDLHGIIRVGGRLKHAQIPYNAKHPIILPGTHHCTRLIIQDVHSRNAHSGPTFTLSLLRERYWITRGRSVTRSVVYNCFPCKKATSKPAPPVMSNLPATRLSVGNPPFYSTGIDYFGPMTVKVGRSRQKRWGCLFTCLTVRAVHLELVESLTTDSCINAIRRFIGRRGVPNTITSDCGTNFKGADRELRESLRDIDQESISNFATDNHFTWHFNPPESPHMGGAWERMVRSVKTALRVILKEQLVGDFTLMTVLTEVESILNSRPLTPLSEDVEDFECLTPNHLLLGRQSSSQPPGVFYELDMSLRKRWRQSQYLADQFWKRWRREYLPTLQIRPKWNVEQRNVSVGDLVLVVEDGVKRSKWKTGRVESVMPGQDGRVRVARVKTSTGSYVRPSAKLCFLESCG